MRPIKTDPILEAFEEVLEELAPEAPISEILLVMDEAFEMFFDDDTVSYPNEKHQVMGSKLVVRTSTLVPRGTFLFNPADVKFKDAPSNEDTSND